MTNAKESRDSIPTWLRTDRWLAVLWQSIGTFSLRGWDVAIDNGDAQHTACHRKEYEGLDEGSRKAEIQKELSISIRLFEILSNDLHKYFYPYSINYYSKTPLSIYICLTEICKVTIACFIPTISVGSTLTRVRFITWTTQYTCWLVERSCELWYWHHVFGAITREWKAITFAKWNNKWITISSTKFLAPLPGIVEFGQLTVHLVA